ncbi:hypothetical protein [Lysobacter gummosus]|uniref:hypothetical protein n=1 Tax=Lysobacter gummosus TaxID=262324 RepID=UPI003641D683
MSGRLVAGGAKSESPRSPFCKGEDKRASAKKSECGYQCEFRTRACHPHHPVLFPL